MKSYVILRRSGWSNRDELEKAASRSTRVGQLEMSDQVRWMRSYVTQEPGGRIGTVCIYQAVSADALREHARRAELPCDSIAPVTDLVLINDDSPALFA